MRLSDYYGFKSTFFFKACIEGERGFTYNLNTKKVKDKINIIKTKGHYLGFHPSENTYNNLYQFKAELNRLKQHTKTAKIEGGRNHLLYYNKNSYAAYENEKLEFNSGFGFQHTNGFRCGTCYDFSVFDVYKRKNLNVKEIPFQIMDTVALRNNYSELEFLKEVNEIIDLVKLHNGILCINWHTNLFRDERVNKYHTVYQNILQKMNELIV
jgi:hypothetical protein